MWQSGWERSLGENRYMYMYGWVPLLSTWNHHICHGLWKWKVKVLITQWCPILFNLRDCRLPGSSVHGILQVRILEWVAIPFSRGSSQPKNRTQVSCMTSRFFTIWATREALCVSWVISKARNKSSQMERWYLPSKQAWHVEVKAKRRWPEPTACPTATL